MSGLCETVNIIQTVQHQTNRGMSDLILSYLISIHTENISTGQTQWSYYRMAKFKSAESLYCNTSATSKASKGQWWKFELHNTSATSKAKWWHFELLAESLVWYPGKIIGQTIHFLRNEKNCHLWLQWSKFNRMKIEVFWKLIIVLSKTAFILYHREREKGPNFYQGYTFVTETSSSLSLWFIFVW